MSFEKPQAVADMAFGMGEGLHAFVVAA